MARREYEGGDIIAVLPSLTCHVVDDSGTHTACGLALAAVDHYPTDDDETVTCEECKWSGWEPVLQ